MKKWIFFSIPAFHFKIVNYDGNCVTSGIFLYSNNWIFLKCIFGHHKVITRISFHVTYISAFWHIHLDVFRVELNIVKILLKGVLLLIFIVVMQFISIKTKIWFCLFRQFIKILINLILVLVL